MAILKKQLTFNVIVEEIDGAFVAHCLETGVVATSALDYNEVQAKMAKMLVRLVEFALKHDRLRDIYHPAPDKYWKQLEAVQEPFQNFSQAIFGNHGGFVVNANTYAAAC